MLTTGAGAALMPAPTASLGRRLGKEEVALQDDAAALQTVAEEIQRHLRTRCALPP